MTIQHLQARLKLSCLDCGTKFSKGHIYCLKCGSRVEKIVAEEREAGRHCDT